MTQNSKVDEIGKWSEDKLDLLAKYLAAYAVIMNKQKQTWVSAYYYIDAFAGSVTPKAKDEERYVAGSPLRALNVTPPFDGLWFIEISERRIRRLERLRQQFPSRKIEIVRGDSNEILLSQILPGLRRNDRAIILLDPYGLQIDWRTIVALASAKKFDVFINLSIMGLTRVLKRNEPPSPQVTALIDRITGDHDWVDRMYAPDPQLRLFGDTQVTRGRLRAEWIASFYAEKIAELFRHVSKPVIMRNYQNSPLYALFLASHNQTAVKITDSIFRRFEGVTGGSE